MAKIKEAADRLFGRKFVCKRCKKTIKANQMKIRAKKIPCPRCGSRDFRPKKKEKRMVAGTAK
ncbi:50S ribosomal protein L40e [Candidatus Woesearchaeota archaeon]|nr:50S ribosomal protein L40e [Candidatus Woesearchaeota archaeon]